METTPVRRAAPARGQRTRRRICRAREVRRKGGRAAATRSSQQSRCGAHHDAPRPHGGRYGAPARRSALGQAQWRAQAARSRSGGA